MNKNKKHILRKIFLEKRSKKLQIKENLIFQQVEVFLQNLISKSTFNRKLHVGIYWPRQNEIDIRTLKDNIKVPFALPCSTSEGEIEYRTWSKELQFKDFYGIPAPINETLLKPKDISVIFVPALAIDKNGNRLGYGGGCFDRLRKNKYWRAIPSFVVLPKVCVSNSLFPIDSWDIPFEGWITETGESQKNKQLLS